MITLPNKPKIIEESENRAVFEITACYPGYGVILGNAIRRVLLSSLFGTAITGIKIKGIQHEFSTIPHVMEDVVQIILNLKQVRFKLHAASQLERTFRATLRIKGEKVVKAGDIKTSSEIEVMNKDIHIATLTDKKADFDMELEIGSGLGYLATEDRKQGKLETGKIAIDAIFSPVTKVNYSVENMRVGDRTDYGRLKITVYTDGTITPKKAFLSTIQLLIDHYKAVASLGDKKAAKKEAKKDTKKAPVIKKKAKESRASRERKVAKELKIEELKLSPRVIAVLRDAGFKTVAGLLKKTEEELQAIDGLGSKGIVEIKRTIGKFGFILKS